MKKLLTLLASFGSAAVLADFPYTEKELWQGIPLHRLPLTSVELITKYEPQRMAGIPGREYQEPHRIAVGLRNVGTNLVHEVQVHFIMIKGTMNLLTPKGDIWTYDIPDGFRGRVTWSEIEPDEETFFPSRPLWDWFPSVTNAPDGAYEFWWTVGTNKSARLPLQKDGLEITNSKRKSRTRQMHGTACRSP